MKKRKFITVSMSVSPGSNEAPKFELEIADTSTDTEQQDNCSERSCTSSIVSFGSSEKQENLTDTATDVTGEGSRLSKRAFKRVLVIELVFQHRCSLEV